MADEKFAFVDDDVDEKSEIVKRNVVFLMTLLVKADQVASTKSKLGKMQSSARRSRGCLKYDVTTDSKVANKIYLIQEWESQESLDVHLTTEQAELQDWLADVVEAEPVFQLMKFVQ